MRANVNGPRRHQLLGCAVPKAERRDRPEDLDARRAKRGGGRRADLGRAPRWLSRPSHSKRLRRESPRYPFLETTRQSRPRATLLANHRRLGAGDAIIVTAI